MLKHYMTILSFERIFHGPRSNYNDNSKESSKNHHESDSYFIDEKIKMPKDIVKLVEDI